ncbi:MAG: HD domain-containing protein [Nitrososphaeraceae archaeon]
MNKILEIVKCITQDREPSHDFYHIMRVIQNAQNIGKKENADLEILFYSALLHDVVVYKKNNYSKDNGSNESARFAEILLNEYNQLDKDKIKLICYAIKVHSFKKKLIPKTLEAKILQDADRIDALGAIGIARLFSVCGSENRKFYHMTDPFYKNERKLDDIKFGLDHFFKKILLLEDTMHTKTGKEIARRRTKFVKKYLNEFEDQLHEY